MKITRKDFGKVARDKVTGFTGIITGKNQWITGCDQVLVQPQVKPDTGEFQEARWFDDNRIEITGDTMVVKLFTDKDKAQEKVGGPARSSVTK